MMTATPTTREEIREQAAGMLPSPGITARLVRRLSVRSTPTRMELGFGRETPPVFAIDRKPNGELIFRSRLIGEWDQEQWDHVELPSPFSENPQHVPQDLHIMITSAIRNQLCHNILTSPRNQLCYNTFPDHTGPDHTGNEAQVLLQELRDLVIDHTSRNHRVQTLIQDTAASLRQLINPAAYQSLRDIILPDTTQPDAPPRPITLWHYNTAANLGDHLPELRRTNPGPTTWVFRTHSSGDRIQHPGQIINLARDSMQAHGLNPRSWRACTRIPPEIIQAMTRHGHHQPATHVMNVIAEAGAIPGPGIAEWAVNLIKRTDSRMDERNSRSPNSSAALLLIFRESQARPDEQDNILRETHNILDFVHDADRQGNPITSRTFARLSRRSNEWHRMIERQAMDRQAMEQLTGRDPQENLVWDSLLETSHVGEYRIIPLTSQIDLLQEGAEMRHCSATYGKRCAAGGHRLFSIRKGGRRVATMEIVLQGNAWKTSQVSGRRNSDPAENILRAAGKIAQAYTDAWTRNPG